MSEEIVPQKPYGIVYCFTNKINGKKYVGQTIRGLEKRIKDHVKSAESGYGCRLIARAIAKYSIDGFDIETLAVAINQDDLNISEEKFITQLKTLSPNGYNLRGGGAHGTYSDETRKIKSDIAKRGGWISRLLYPDGTNRFPITDDDRRKGALVRRGRKHSLEHRAAIGRAHRERTFSEKHLAKLRLNIAKASASNVGRKLSPERKEKLRLSHTGRVLSEQRLAQLRQQIIDCKDARIKAVSKPRTAEVRARIAASLSGRKRPKEISDKANATKLARGIIKKTV